MGLTVIRKMYLNLESSLLIEAKLSKEGKFLGCYGKHVDVETCEMNTFCIMGKYYRISEFRGELLELEEVK